MYRPKSVEGEGVPMEMSTRKNDRPALREIGNIALSQGYQCAASKRVLSEIAVDGKDSKRFVGHRPMTRRFAASLANQVQPCHQGPVTKQAPIGSERQLRSSASAPSSNDHSVIVIDVDNEDLSRPMMEEIEEMVTCELKEIEMEDLEDEQQIDIDSCDAKDQLAVAEYVEDIHNFYWQTENLGCVSPDYMSNQYDINEKMRAILVDWLIEVHYKFELMDQTLFLTINIIDRFLAQHTLARKKLQLVGVTAMLLACKYEEVSVPVVEDLVLISDRAYTREEILDMEKLMINTLQFNLSMPTAYVFMRRFLKAAEFDKKLELLSFYLVELSLVEYQMLKFQPSLLAAAAVYTAQCTLKGFKIWSKTSAHHSRYSETQLMECSRLMVEFHQKAGQGKLTGALRKYSTFKFGYAAKIKPAVFLLEEAGNFA